MANDFPWYAPGQFLLAEYRTLRSRDPRLLQEVELTTSMKAASPGCCSLAILEIRIGPERAEIMVVDNAAKKIHGHLYVDKLPGRCHRPTHCRCGG